MNDRDTPGVGHTSFDLIFPKEFEKKHTVGFDDYKQDFTPSKGLFFQLNKGKVFEYEGREKSKITKRDIVLAVIYIFKEYVMPYTKNKVTTEEDLDIEVNHFSFLNKYNLL